MYTQADEFGRRDSGRYRDQRLGKDDTSMDYLLFYLEKAEVGRRVNLALDKLTVNDSETVSTEQGKLGLSFVCRCPEGRGDVNPQM